MVPGGYATIDVELSEAFAVERGTRFAVREGGRTVGVGIVTGIARLR